VKRAWTPEEDATLRALYPEGRREELLAALPGRPWHGIQTHASKLGVHQKPRWSPEDDALLRSLWPDCGTRTLRKRLRRSWASIVHRAVTLELTKQRWAGYVTINRATRITGLVERAFLRALAEYQEHFATIPAGSERDALSSPSLVYRRKSGRFGHRMVDAQAARDAAEWWLARETMTQAAKRLRVPVATLSDAARAVGERVGKYRRRAPEWWDGIVARRGALPEMRAAA